MDISYESEVLNMKDATIEFFKEFGNTLLKAVYLEDLIRWYGPLFVKWYNEYPHTNKVLEYNKHIKEELVNG